MLQPTFLYELSLQNAYFGFFFKIVRWNLMFCAQKKKLFKYHNCSTVVQ